METRATGKLGIFLFEWCESEKKLSAIRETDQRNVAQLEKEPFCRPQFQFNCFEENETKSSD